MPVIKGLEENFETVASSSEKLRPDYVKELYKAISDHISVKKESNVIERG